MFSCILLICSKLNKQYVRSLVTDKIFMVCSVSKRGGKWLIFMTGLSISYPPGKVYLHINIILSIVMVVDITTILQVMHNSKQHLFKRYLWCVVSKRGEKWLIFMTGLSISYQHYNIRYAHIYACVRVISAYTRTLNVHEVGVLYIRAHRSIRLHKSA